MANLSQEITINIIEELVKIVPYLEVDIRKQIEIRNKIEEQLNDYDITSKCTALTKSDLLDKAFIFLACKKLEGMKATTRYNYTLLFKKMDQFFNKPISMITIMDLRMFLAKEYPDNQSSSVNTKICYIKSFFTWLQDEGYIIQNPTRNLIPVKEPKRKRKHMPSIDIEKMREQCETIRQKALFEFLLSTGCRVSEVSNATIDRINWDKNSIMVIGKGDKEREVLFSTRTRLFLMNYISEREKQGIYSNSLFVASKKPYATLGQRSIEREIESLSKKAGINYNVFPHLFRHTYATTGVNQNVPIPVLQQLLGHSSPVTTQTYYNLNDENVKHEYKKIAL